MPNDHVCTESPNIIVIQMSREKSLQSISTLCIRIGRPVELIDEMLLSNEIR